MPFSLRSLSVLNYANGFTSWHYAAQDLDEALDAEFFNPASDLIACGDKITISTPTRGAERFIAYQNKDIILLKGE